MKTSDQTKKEARLGLCDVIRGAARNLPLTSYEQGTIKRILNLVEARVKGKE